MTYELAPVAVIRAAAWPLETLDVFGGGGTADYDATIARERETLWERTAADPRFMKALALASAPLAERVQKHTGPAAARNKRARHLDTSLYRYLARAVTTPTPHGLWAGVTLARFGDEDRAASAPARVDFTPDLVPFAAAFAKLGERYGEVARFRLSPTLRPRAEGTWSFLSRAFGGAIELREINSDATLGPLLERIGNAGAGTLDELATRARVPREVLDVLHGSGALVGGLAFPTRFTSAWEALEVAGELLLRDDRDVWRRVVSELSAACASLAEDFDSLSASDLAARVAKAREPLAALGVSARPLRCDLRLPFNATLGPRTRTELHDCLAAHDGALTRSTHERRRALLARLARGPIAIGDEIAALPLEPSSPELPNPWGCLVARLGRVTHVVGIDDSPIRPFARLNALLGDDADAWAKQLVAKLEADHGVIACELAVPFEDNPNVQARPKITAQAFEPWGAEGPDLRGAELRAEAGALVLHVPSIGRVMVVAACSATSVPCDPMAGPFAVMGFNESLEAGVGEPAPTALRELITLPRAERYARWLDLAASQSWPERMSIAIDGGRPLVVPTSSPLAVEAAFEGARESVVVEPAHVSARLAGYVADVAVPFSRTPHAYSALTPSGVRRES